jgi:hypothetical protein
MLFLGGCSQITHDEFVNQASQVCDSAIDPVSQLGRPFLEQPAAPPDLPRWAEVLSRLVVVRSEMLDEFRAIDPPDDDRALVARWLAALDRSVADLARARTEAARGDLLGFRAALVASGGALSRAAVIANGFGLSRCRA